MGSTGDLDAGMLQEKQQETRLSGAFAASKEWNSPEGESSRVSPE